jgi:prepilin-type N-terminal cleavage/methylation domain-containing protein
MSLTRHCSGRGGSRGFTLVELLVVIGIIAILVSFLMPAFRRARNQAAKINCQSQLRQIGQAVTMYTNQFKGWLPGAHAICDPRQPPGGASTPVDTGLLWVTGCLRDKPIWQCPVDPRAKETFQFSYTYNGRMIVVPGHDDEVSPPVLEENPPLGSMIKPQRRKVTTFRDPARCLTFGEENVTGYKVGPYVINDPYFIYDDVSDDRHLGKCCVVYLDGHAGEIPGRLKLYYDKEYGYCH